ncbi:MAG: T9SS type A sorting domain-containing protein, partial [Hymenobacter sp.]
VFTNVATSDWSTDVPAACGLLGTVAASSGSNGLALRPLENPVPGARASVAIAGAAGQLVTLRLYDTLGALLLTQEVKPATDGELVAVPLPPAAGLYVLQASQGSRTASTRLLKW